MAVTKQKVRDWLVYMYAVVPVSVKVRAQRVEVVVPAADVRRGLNLEGVAQELAAFIDRDAEVKSE